MLYLPEKWLEAQVHKDAKKVNLFSRSYIPCEEGDVVCFSHKKRLKFLVDKIEVLCPSEEFIMPTLFVSRVETKNSLGMLKARVLKMLDKALDLVFIL
jgi:hypothetical protein